MLLTIIEILSLLGALGISFGTGGLEGLRWLWQIPLLFVGLWLAQVVLLVAFTVVYSRTVNTEKPVEKEKQFDRRFVEMLAETALRLLHVKLHISGMEKLPKEGRFLLVCNHLHILDPVVLLHVFRGNKLTFVSKRENDTMFVVGRMMHLLRTQLINRENDREALKTILSCIDILKKDEGSIMIFPEGYTSPDGKLHRFRNGSFKIAQRAKVPVVVCTLKHTSRVFPNFLRFRRPHVELELVDVIAPEEITGTAELGEQVYDLMARSVGDSVG